MLVIIHIILDLFIYYFIILNREDTMSDKNRSQSEIYKKMVIKESLLKLLTERSINKVTVTDICREANINRNTFYSHYASQFELLSTIEK
ncbi:TetR/AcrR family transcriptional regulator [Paenibacillus rhizoplanae]